MRTLILIVLLSLSVAGRSLPVPVGAVTMGSLRADCWNSVESGNDLCLTLQQLNDIMLDHVRSCKSLARCKR